MQSNSVEYWVFFWDFCCPFIKGLHQCHFAEHNCIRASLFASSDSQRYVDVFYVNLLYLSQSTGWRLAIITHVFFVCVVDLVVISIDKDTNHHESSRSQRAISNSTVDMDGTGFVLHRLSISSIAFKPDDSLYLASFSFPCDLQKANIRSTKWYIFDIPTLIFPMILTPEIGIPIGYLLENDRIAEQHHTIS